MVEEKRVALVAGKTTKGYQARGVDILGVRSRLKRHWEYRLPGSPDPSGRQRLGERTLARMTVAAS